MASLKGTIHGVLSFIAALCWLAALGVLAWQSWGWLNTGIWSTIPISIPFTYVFDQNAYEGASTAFHVIYAIMAQSLALGLGLLGLALNTLAKAFDR